MKKTTIIVIIIVVIILGLGVGIYFWKFSGKETNTSMTSNKTTETTNKSQTNTNQAVDTTLASNRVKGNMDDYADISKFDKENVDSDIITKTGGVLEADLAGNIKAYLVMPKGYVIQTATVTMLPYTEMPSSSTHLALSKDYGYGVYVDIESIQMGLGAYLVFDLKGGEAQKEAANHSDFYNRCDPKMTSFNPLICARQNGVKIDNLVDKNSGVVSPIYDSDGNNNLVFARTTFPIGIDGLLVTEIKGSGIYLPQKLDQSLVEDLMETTIGNYDNHWGKLEMAAQAVEWGLTDSLTESQYNYLLSSTLSNDNYRQMIRSIFVAESLMEVLEDVIAATTDEDELEIWQDIHDELEYSYTEISGDLLNDAESDTSGTYIGPEATEAAATVGGLADADFEGADETSANMAENMEDNFGEDVQDTESAQNAAEGSSMLGEEETSGESLEEIKEKARQTIEETINDPNATITDLIKAGELAQLLGLDEEYMDEIMDKIKEKLEEEIEKENTKRGLIYLAGICQALGFDDLADKALEKAKTASDPTCDELINKTLKTYGIQECQ